MCDVVKHNMEILERMGLILTSSHCLMHTQYSHSSCKLDPLNTVHHQVLCQGLITRLGDMTCCDLTTTCHATISSPPVMPWSHHHMSCRGLITTHHATALSPHVTLRSHHHASCHSLVTTCHIVVSSPRIIYTHHAVASSPYVMLWSNHQVPYCCLITMCHTVVTSPPHHSSFITTHHIAISPCSTPQSHHHLPHCGLITTCDTTTSPPIMSQPLSPKLQCRFNLLKLSVYLSYDSDGQ